MNALSKPPVDTTITPTPTTIVPKSELPNSREVIIVNVPQPSSGSKAGWSDASISIAATLAWPLTLVIALMLFKRPITRFIDRLRAFKGAGMEMSTETMIEKELPVRQSSADSEIDPYSSPIDTIVTAWVSVEKAARDAALKTLPQSSVGTRTMPYSTVLRNVEALERAGFLTNPAVRPLISDLAKIRNQAVHRPDEQISRDALAQFVSNANWATTKLLEIIPN